MLLQLAPKSRNRLFFGAGALLATLTGFFIAQGGFLIPTLVIAGSVAVIVSLIRTTVFQTCIVGALVAGYIIGNRGFAQFSLVPGLPLLPAESAILVLAGLQLVHRAVSGPSPARIGVMDVLIIIWVIIGGVRFLFDFRQYGFNALRDFATVYYAIFYFLAQNLGRQSPKFAERLATVLRISAVVMLVTHQLWNHYPAFFYNTLQIRGIPLIFYKADLVGIYLAIGTLLQYLRFEQKGGWWRWPLMGAMCLSILGTDNRAAMLALTMGGFWLVASGRWRLALVVAISALIAVFGTLWIAQITNTPWEDTPLRGMYDKVISIVDPSGQLNYRGSETFNKGDNNRYRLVWWSTVIRETWDESPLLGLGFGHDLARAFMENYYGDTSGDYAVRSPHSIFVTVLARMGIVGFLPFASLIALLIRQTWNSVSTHQTTGLEPRISAWVILVSAAFGVVLEGPMGAVIFWLLLGAASGVPQKADAEQSHESDNESPPIRGLESPPIGPAKVPSKGT